MDSSSLEKARKDPFGGNAVPWLILPAEPSS